MRGPPLLHNVVLPATKSRQTVARTNNTPKTAIEKRPRGWMNVKVPSQSSTIVAGHLSNSWREVPNAASPSSQKVPGNKKWYTYTPALCPSKYPTYPTPNTPLNRTIARMDNYIVSNGSTTNKSRSNVDAGTLPRKTSTYRGDGPH